MQYKIKDYLNTLSLRLYQKELQENSPNTKQLLRFFNDAVKELSYKQNWSFLNKGEFVRGYILDTFAKGDDFASRNPGLLTQTEIIRAGVNEENITDISFKLVNKDIAEINYFWLSIALNSGFGTCSGRIKVDIVNENNEVLYNFSDYLILNNYVYDIYDDYKLKYFLGVKTFSLSFYPLSKNPTILLKNKTYKIRITSTSTISTQRGLNVYYTIPTTQEYISSKACVSSLVGLNNQYLLSAIAFDLADFTNKFYVNEANKKDILYISPCDSEVWGKGRYNNIKILKSPLEIRGSSAFYSVVTNNIGFDVIGMEGNKYVIEHTSYNAPIFYVQYKYVFNDFSYNDETDFPDIFYQTALLLAEYYAKVNGHGLIDNANVTLARFNTVYEELCRMYSELPNNILP